jgi:hypothetical protein
VAVLGLLVFLILFSVFMVDESRTAKAAFDRLMVGKSQQEKDDLWLLLKHQKAKLIINTDGKVDVDRIR